MEKQNPMKEIKIEKLIFNVGAGRDENKLKNGKRLIKQLTGKDPVETKTQKRIQTWGLRPGLAVGCKLTIRDQKEIKELIKRVLDAIDFRLKESCFADNGNVAFGLKEYIYIPGMKYDPKIGSMGFQVTIKFERAGARIAKRSIKRKKLNEKARINPEETKEYMKKHFGVKIGEEE